MVTQEEISQTQNTQNINLFGKWIPVRVTAYNTLLKKIDILKNGLWLMYTDKQYSIPPNIRFIVQPELLKQKESEYALENTEALVRFRVYPSNKNSFIDANKVLGDKTTEKSKLKFADTTKTLSIELIKSSSSIIPRYRLILIRIFGKRTNSGTYRLLNCVSGCENILWTSLEVSGGGTHWYYNLVLFLKRNQKTTLEYECRSEKKFKKELIVF